MCTRPKELTRQDLRELITILETKGFKQSHLQTAWKQTKNEDIAADIITFIRQALGDALVDHEARIKRAMQKVYSLHDWTPRHKNGWSGLKTVITSTSVSTDSRRCVFRRTIP